MSARHRLASADGNPAGRRTVAARARTVTSRAGGAAALVGCALLVMVLAACTAPTSPAEPPLRSDRQRLVEAYRDSDSRLSELIRDVKTSVVRSDTPWLTGWRILDVTVTALPHPRRFAVALSDDERLEPLAGRPESFTTMLRDAAVAVDSADRAAAVTEVFLDSTRTYQTYSYRVASVADIGWRPQRTAAQEQDRLAVVAAYADRISATTATPAGAGGGWTVTTWMVAGTDPVRHTTTLRTPSIDDRIAVERRDLPVPVSA